MEFRSTAMGFGSLESVLLQTDLSNSPQIFHGQLPKPVQVKAVENDSKPTVLALNDSCSLSSARRALSCSSEENPSVFWMQQLSPPGRLSFHGDLSEEEAEALVKDASPGSYVCYTLPNQSGIRVTWRSRQRNAPHPKTCYLDTPFEVNGHIGVAGMQPLENQRVANLRQKLWGHTGYWGHLSDSVRKCMLPRTDGIYYVCDSLSFAPGIVVELFSNDQTFKILGLPAPNGSGWYLHTSRGWVLVADLEQFLSLIKGLQQPLSRGEVSVRDVTFETLLDQIPDVINQTELLLSNVMLATASKMECQRKVLGIQTLYIAGGLFG